MHTLIDPADAVSVSVFDSGYEPGLESLDTYWWEKICSWTSADVIEQPRLAARAPAEVTIAVSFSAEDAALLEAEDALALDSDLGQYWAFAYIRDIATRQSPKP